MEDAKVTIGLERYEELVRKSAMVDIVKNWVEHDKYLNRDELKMILGIEIQADDED